MRDEKNKTKPTNPNPSSYAAWVQCAAMCPSARGTAVLTFAPLAATTWQANRRAEAARSSLLPLLIFLSLSLCKFSFCSCNCFSQLLFVIFHFNFTSVDFFISLSLLSSTLASSILELNSLWILFPSPDLTSSCMTEVYSQNLLFLASFLFRQLLFSFCLIPMQNKTKQKKPTNKKPQTLWRQKLSQFCFLLSCWSAPSSAKEETPDPPTLMGSPSLSHISCDEVLEQRSCGCPSSGGAQDWLGPWANWAGREQPAHSWAWIWLGLKLHSKPNHSMSLWSI